MKQVRHSGESRNPVCKPGFKRKLNTWIPAFAGMTILALSSFNWAAEPELISFPSVTEKFIPADSLRPTISDDGWVVAFESSARLTAEDKNKSKDVYVYDRRSRKLKLIAGLTSKNYSGGPALSGDGKVLAFHSVPKPLKKEIAPRTSEILWVRWADGKPEILTRGIDGRPNDGEALFPMLNRDGNRVLFTSNATNQVAGIKNPIRSVYVLDRASGETALISKSDDNAPVNRSSGYPRMSSDGLTVAFLSAATNLDPTLPVESLGMHLYLHDRTTGKNIRIDKFERGFNSNEWMPGAFDIDGAGQTIVFEARHRVPGEPFKSLIMTDLFVYDRLTDKVNLLTTGIFSNRCHNPSLSKDGRFAAFVLHPDTKTGDKGGVVVYDRQANVWRRVVEGVCGSPEMSKNGRVIAFTQKGKKNWNVYAVPNPFMEDDHAGD